MSVYFGDVIESSSGGKLIDLTSNQVKGYGVFANSGDRDVADDSVKMNGYVAVTAGTPYLFLGNTSTQWSTAANWHAIATESTTTGFVDIESLTSVAAPLGSDIPTLLSEGNSGSGVLFAGHVSATQGTVKFTFNDFLAAFGNNIVGGYISEGYGTETSYEGGTGLVGDINGDGVVGVADILTILSNFGNTGMGDTVAQVGSTATDLWGWIGANQSNLETIVLDASLAGASTFYFPVPGSSSNAYVAPTGSLQGSAASGLGASSSGGGYSDSSGYFSFLNATTGNEFELSSNPQCNHYVRVELFANYKITTSFGGILESWMTIEYRDSSGNIITYGGADVSGDVLLSSSEFPEAGEVTWNSMGSAGGYIFPAGLSPVNYGSYIEGIVVNNQGVTPPIDNNGFSADVAEIRIKPYLKSLSGYFEISEQTTAQIPRLRVIYDLQSS